jgi:carbon starvation protein
MSFLAGCVTLLQFFEAGNYLLVVLDVIVLVTSLLVMLEAGGVIAAHRKSVSDVKSVS